MVKIKVECTYNKMLFLMRNEVLIHATTWMNPGNFEVSERSQTHSTYCSFPSIWKIQIGKDMETESRLMVSRDWEEGGMGDDGSMGVGV